MKLTLTNFNLHTQYIFFYDNPPSHTELPCGVLRQKEKQFYQNKT